MTKHREVEFLGAGAEWRQQVSLTWPQRVLGSGRLRARAKIPVFYIGFLRICRNRVGTVATALETVVGTVVNHIETVIFWSKGSRSGLQSRNSTVSM